MRAPPMCRKPVGDGAKRVRTFIGGAGSVLAVLDRQSLQERGTVGRLGRYAGQFVSPHNIATDSRGNLYVAEDLGGQRMQKFVLKDTSGSPQR